MKLLSRSLLAFIQRALPRGRQNGILKTAMTEEEFIHLLRTREGHLRPVQMILSLRHSSFFGATTAIIIFAKRLQISDRHRASFA